MKHRSRQILYLNAKPFVYEQPLLSNRVGLNQQLNGTMERIVSDDDSCLVEKYKGIRFLYCNRLLNIMGNAGGVFPAQKCNCPQKACACVLYVYPSVWVRGLTHHHLPHWTVTTSFPVDASFTTLRHPAFKPMTLHATSSCLDWVNEPLQDVLTEEEFVEVGFPGVEI